MATDSHFLIAVKAGWQPAALVLLAGYCAWLQYQVHATQAAASEAQWTASVLGARFDAIEHEPAPVATAATETSESAIKALFEPLPAPTPDPGLERRVLDIETRLTRICVNSEGRDCP